MIGIAVLLLGAAAGAATPCESLTSLKLADTTITSAVVVPEGPPPARGAGGGGAAGGAAEQAPQVQHHKLASQHLPPGRCAARKYSGSLPRSDGAQADVRLPDQYGALAADPELERKVHGRRQWRVCGLHPGLEQRDAPGAAPRICHGRHRHRPPGARRKLGHRPSGEDDRLRLPLDARDDRESQSRSSRPSTTRTRSTPTSRDAPRAAAWP